MACNSTREIVTLQFGHYANFVGSHWWNIQTSAFVYNPNDLTGPKEINNDVLFREGENLMNEVTYTPRLIIFDLKGSLNTLKETGTLYDLETPVKHVNSAWVGNVAKHDFGCVSKNEFLQDLDYEEAMERGCLEKDNDESERQEMAAGKSENVFGQKLYNLDDSVTVWSDFLKPHLHPKTLDIINNFWHDNEHKTFDVFGYGVDAYKEQQQEIEDRLHFFTEECDNLEGFLLMVDSYNAFGGLASSFMGDVLDDYRKKSVMVYSVSPATFSSMSVNEERNRLTNLVMAYDALLSNASIFVPLSTSASPWKGGGPFAQLPNLQYKPGLPYHSSALLASTIDTLTLPFRLVNRPATVSDMTNTLTQSGKKLMSAHLSLALPILETLSCNGGNISQHLHSLTPYIPNISDSPYSQYTVSRGLDRPSNSSSFGSYTTEVETVDSLILAHLEKAFKTSYHLSYNIRQPCKVTSPYPNIFTSDVSRSGQISTLRNQPNNQRVQSVPVMATLQSSSGGKAHLEALQTEIGKLKVHKLHSFMEAGLEPDQFQEMLESLKSQILCYDESESSMDMN